MIPGKAFLQKALFPLVLFSLFNLTPVSASDGIIAVFAPDPGDLSLSEETLRMLHDGIAGAFRFDHYRDTVLLDVSPGSGRIGGLIDLIRGVDIGEDLDFSEDIILSVKDASLVVIPEIIHFLITPEDDETSLCRLDILLSFLDPGSTHVFDTLTLGVTGTGESPEGALEGAVEALAESAEEKLRLLPFFKSVSQIVEIIDPRRIVLSFGKRNDVRSGDEYLIVPVSGSGLSGGMVLVEHVSEQVSYGYVLYSSEPVDQYLRLEKIERAGVDLSLYGRTMIGLSADEDNSTIPFSAVFGVRGFPSLGLFRVRPFLGLEVPVHEETGQWPGMPFNFLLGLETRWNIGRFQIAPSASLGMGILVPVEEGEEFLLSHTGSVMEVVFNRLFHQNIRAFFTVGYAGWYRISSTSLSITGRENYGGILVGAGIRIQL